LKWINNKWSQKKIFNKNIDFFSYIFLGEIWKILDSLTFCVQFLFSKCVVCIKMICSKIVLCMSACMHALTMNMCVFYSYSVFNSMVQTWMMVRKESQICTYTIIVKYQQEDDLRFSTTERPEDHRSSRGLWCQIFPNVW
jgi:hypothetical protein